MQARTAPCRVAVAAQSWRAGRKDACGGALTQKGACRGGMLPETRRVFIVGTCAWQTCCMCFRGVFHHVVLPVHCVVMTTGGARMCVGGEAERRTACADAPRRSRCCASARR